MHSATVQICPLIILKTVLYKFQGVFCIGVTAIFVTKKIVWMSGQNLQVSNILVQLFLAVYCANTLNPRNEPDITLSVAYDVKRTVIFLYCFGGLTQYTIALNRAVAGKKTRVKIPKSFRSAYSAAHNGA